MTQKSHGSLRSRFERDDQKKAVREAKAAARRKLIYLFFPTLVIYILLRLTLDIPILLAAAVGALFYVVVAMWRDMFAEAFPRVKREGR